jgi:hypothetical protein
MVNGLLCFALGSIYTAKKTMRLADLKLIPILGEEVDRARCGFFCGVEFLVDSNNEARVSNTGLPPPHHRAV